MSEGVRQMPTELLIRCASEVGDRPAEFFRFAWLICDPELGTFPRRPKDFGAAIRRNPQGLVGALAKLAKAGWIEVIDDETARISRYEDFRLARREAERRDFGGDGTKLADSRDHSS